MKKKIFLLLPALFLALSLGACNGKKDSSKQSGDDSDQQQPSGGGEQSGGEGQGGEGSGGEQSGGEGQGGEGSGGEGSGGEGSGGESTPEDGRSEDAITTGAAMKVGSRYYALESYEETMGSPEGAWKKEGFVAEAGEEVSFTLDGTALEVFSDGDSSGNNITEEHPMQDAVASVHVKVGGTMAVYLKHWASGAYTFWLTTPSSGGEGGQGGEGQEGEVTYTCTGLPDWITNDGCVIFAWVWSPSDGGSWKSCEYAEPATEVSFVTAEELTGFLLVRCAQGTTQPDWSATTDGPGKIYNKTQDIACVAGTHSYECSNWVNP